MGGTGIVVVTCRTSENWLPTERTCRIVKLPIFLNPHAEPRFALGADTYILKCVDAVFSPRGLFHSMLAVLSQRLTVAERRQGNAKQHRAAADFLQAEIRQLLRRLDRVSKAAFSMLFHSMTSQLAVHPQNKGQSGAG